MALHKVKTANRGVYVGDLVSSMNASGTSIVDAAANWPKICDPKLEVQRVLR
jgi:hypothetical protein